MKPIRLRTIINFNLSRFLGLLLLVLVAAMATAQQEVDPDHFDDTSTTVLNHPPSPHRKPTKTTQKHTHRKTASSTAKRDSHKVDQSAQNKQPVVGFDKTATDQGRK